MFLVVGWEGNMAQGHGIIINLSTGLPFVFTNNPAEISTQKKINYFEAPNIGGSSHKKYFTGFGNKQINVTLTCINKESPLGVSPEIAFFETLREPDIGLKEIFSFSSGNENYPPPQVLWTFGTGSLVPLVYYVDDVNIKTSMLMDGIITGVIGIPRRADITIQLSLDEDNVLNKANRMAQKASAIVASVESVIRDVKYRTTGGKRENISLLPKIGGF
jgi:hypothetical protein